MRAFTRTTLAALAALLFAAAPAPAQETAGAWVRLAPEPEGFVALMPAPPATQDVRLEAGGFKVAGRAYVAAGDGGATYTVIALDFPQQIVERLIAANRITSARDSAQRRFTSTRLRRPRGRRSFKPERNRLRRRTSRLRSRNVIPPRVRGGR